MRDKLTAAEKVRREKWVEAKQKEIKALTVKGLEPEIARLIARHKQVNQWGGEGVIYYYILYTVYC